MKLTAEDGRSVVAGTHPEWVTKWGTVDEVGTWMSGEYVMAGVFMHTPSGKHYRIRWVRSDRELPFEYANPTPVEVVRREVKRYEWQTV